MVKNKIRKLFEKPSTPKQGETKKKDVYGESLAQKTMTKEKANAGRGI